MDWITTGIAALLGSVLPTLFKFILDFFKAKTEITTAEHKTLSEEQRQFRMELQDRINDLLRQLDVNREELNKLQDDRIRCLEETAELNAQVRLLTHENIELKKRVSALEAEVKFLRERGRKRLVQPPPED